jgi:3-hydroxybutyryl-CoA dehydrogenase
MGAGIAQIAALGGYETRLHDPIPAALDAGIERLRTALAKGASKGMWSEKDAETASAGTGAAASLADLRECDLVIEAAPEDLGLKRELFAALAEACGPNTILASNTSSLPVTAIASLVPHPERIVGMHFFNPPALMKLVEVVATADSSEEALEATADAAKRMGRTPIRAKDSPGFIANRLARPFTLESLRMLTEEVADVETIDRVCRLGGGFKMGPFELIDLIGLDVNLSVARSFYAQGGEPERWRPSQIQERLVAEGRLGRKSGAGFYNYNDRKGDGEAPANASAVGFVSYFDRTNSGTEVVGPTLDSAALAEIDPAAGEILPRLVAQIANEAAFALEEEVGSPADMDTAMRLGFNWPLGPLEFADLIGAGRAIALLEDLRARHGEAYVPAPLLHSAAERDLALRDAA